MTAEVVHLLNCAEATLSDPGSDLAIRFQVTAGVSAPHNDTGRCRGCCEFVGFLQGSACRKFDQGGNMTIQRSHALLKVHRRWRRDHHCLAALQDGFNFCLSGLGSHVWRRTIRPCHDRARIPKIERSPPILTGAHELTRRRRNLRFRRALLGAYVGLLRIRPTGLFEQYPQACLLLFIQGDKTDCGCIRLAIPTY